MISFTIKTDQLSRIKILQDYIKKMETFSSLDKKQVFVLENDKLTIFGKADSAGAGHIEATFDISNLNKSESFGFELDKFINYLEKCKSDEINISIANNKITFKTKTNKLIINEALVFTALDPQVLTELKDNIKNKLALPEFKKPIEIKLDHRDLITELGTMTKLQDTNHQILLGKDFIKSADTLCILSLKSSLTIVQTDEEVFIDRDITSIFKNTDSFKISSDKKYFYFDIQNYGIKLIFVPKTFNWSFPTDQDIIDISPEAKKLITLKINTERFYEELSKFEGVFETGTWRYGQIKIRTPKGFKDELELSFDNSITEVFTTLPITITSNTDKTDNFEFMIPTIHFKSLKSILSSEDTFTFKYSSSKLSDPNGVAIIIENTNANIILAKMEE